ncbi:MAG: hypothetical protein R3B06_19710 [Kofleriaceae bacterium]
MARTSVHAMTWRQPAPIRTAGTITAIDARNSVTDNANLSGLIAGWTPRIGAAVTSSDPRATTTTAALATAAQASTGFVPLTTALKVMGADASTRLGAPRATDLVRRVDCP